MAGFYSSSTYDSCSVSDISYLSKMDVGGAEAGAAGGIGMYGNGVGHFMVENGTSSSSSSASSDAGGSTPEMVALRKLSENIAWLLRCDGDDLCDAEIMVEGHAVGVHRCILAARSEFLRQKLQLNNNNNNNNTANNAANNKKGGRCRYDLQEWLKQEKEEPGQDPPRVGREALLTVLGYVYSGEVKAPPVEACTCADETCTHVACGPAVQLAVQLLYAAYAFRIPELVSLSQRRLQDFVDVADVEDVIPILVAAHACKSETLLSKCVQRVGASDLDNVSLAKEIPLAILQQVLGFRSSSGQIVHDDGFLLAKSIRRIHSALDSDDVELVKMLLQEGAGCLTLDHAFALHYAAAYCNPRIMPAILDNLSEFIKDINRRTPRGYTALHIAARRLEPNIIRALLTKGANVVAKAPNERTAVQIAKRLTKYKDFWQGTVQGREPSKEKECIDLLESKEREISCPGYFLPVAEEDVVDRDELLDLETRVALAKILYPDEARWAMEIANVDQTEEFRISRSKCSCKENSVDLNVAPFHHVNCLKNKNKNRLAALKKTVELGRARYPRCSEVLDKFMVDDNEDIVSCNPEEQEKKRKRLEELKNNLSEAFIKDTEEITTKSTISSSSSSSSLREGSRCRHIRPRQTVSSE